MLSRLMSLNWPLARRPHAGAPSPENLAALALLQASPTLSQRVAQMTGGQPLTRPQVVPERAPLTRRVP